MRSQSRKSRFEEELLQNRLSPCELQSYGIPHVNVIFARIAATAADRRALALGFILKPPEGNVSLHVCLLRNIILSIYTGCTSVHVGLSRLTTREITFRD